MRVVDPGWVTPVHAPLTALARAVALVVTVEDGNVTGGVGTRIAQALADASVIAPVRQIGIPATVPRPWRGYRREDWGGDDPSRHRPAHRRVVRGRCAHRRPSYHHVEQHGGAEPAEGGARRTYRGFSLMRILVVEDEVQLAEAVARGLRREGMAVDVATDGDDGYRKASLTRYDVVVLDRDLPACAATRSAASCPTRGPHPRHHADRQRHGRGQVSGLALGADDYLPKPFAFAELVARVRALGRRTTPAAPPVLTAGDIELDPAKRTVTRRGEMIDLTRKEFGVLETLLMAQGAVVSSEELLDRVWDENADPFTTTVRVTMMTLRRKLGEPADHRHRRRLGLPHRPGGARADREAAGAALVNCSARRCACEWRCSTADLSCSSASPCCSRRSSCSTARSGSPVLQAVWNLSLKSCGGAPAPRTGARSPVRRRPAPTLTCCTPA